MKNFIKILFLTFISFALFSKGLNAQEIRLNQPKFLDNWSLSGAIGANTTFADKSELINPNNIGVDAWVSLNKEWSPFMGTRLQLGWNKTNVLNYPFEWGGTRNVLKKLTQQPNNLNASLDFTFNVLNAFRLNTERNFNILAIVGVGYSHLFDKHNSDSETYGFDYDYKKGNYIVPKVGLQLNYRVTEPVSLFIEGDFKAYNDKLDMIVNKAQYDGQLQVTLGMTYHFKNHDGTRRFQLIKSYNQEDIDKLNGEINNLRTELDKKPKEVEVIKEVKVDNNIIEKEIAPITVSFAINSAVIDKKQQANIENVANFLKENEDINISVVGYADKKTGTTEYNKELSIKRAENVANVLVEKYNINKNRLKVVGEGDAVQKYSENDWNRAVIFVKE